MRKFLLALGVVAMISGCATTNSTTDKADMKTVHQMPNKMQTIIFTDVNNPNYKVSATSSDMFDTAIFIDANGKKHELKNAPSASGTRLINEAEGIELFFGKGVAFFTPKKDAKELQLKYQE